MTEEANYLAVARFRKPHGLRGEALLVPLTDEPETVFTVGRVLVPIDEATSPTGPGRAIASARPHQRLWRIAFEGVADRAALEAWGPRLLAARQDALRPLGDDEMYVHEIPGARVLDRGVDVGVAKDVVFGAGGDLLIVERDGREFLIPMHPPVLQGIRRKERLIDVSLPPGIFDI